MLGAGHIRYYLHKWKNLNRFLNQEWESYNAMLESFWHHRTRKGGGKNDKRQSKIKPIDHWILRLMLWHTCVTQKYFRDLENNNSWSDDELYDSNGSF
jgi:hypothetical protein